MNLLAVSNVNLTKQGFTLVEVMLVVSLMLIIGAIISPVGVSFYRTQLLNEATDGLVISLRQAQSFSMSGKDNSSYGVYLQEGQYTLFMGDGYDLRDVSEDEVWPIAGTVDITGPSEVVFSKLTGEPSASGTYIISLGVKQKQIEILESGNISR